MLLVSFRIVFCVVWVKGFSILLDVMVCLNLCGVVGLRVSIWLILLLFSWYSFVLGVV